MTCSPQIASSALADLMMVPEVCYGQVPVGRAAYPFLRRSTSLTLTRDNYQSEMMRPDRMVSDMRLGSKSVSGDVVSELTLGRFNYPMFWAMQGAMGGWWYRPDSLSLAGAEIDSNGRVNRHTMNLRIGDVVTVANTTDQLGVPVAYQGMPLYVATKNQTSNFTLLRRYDGPTREGFAPYVNLTGGAPFVVPQGYSIGIGNAQHSFSMERVYSDMGKAQVFTGVRVSTMAVDVPATGLPTVTFGMMGKDAKPLSLPILSASNTQKVWQTAAPRTASVGPNDYLQFESTPSGQHIMRVLEPGGLPSIDDAGARFDRGGNFKPGDIVEFQGTGIAQNNNRFTVVQAFQSHLELAEAVEPGAVTTANDWKIIKVYSAPGPVSIPESLSSAAGSIFIDFDPVGTVTSLAFTLDNQMAAAQVVGSDTVPKIMWGNQVSITGTMTVLFDDDVAAKLYSNFYTEQGARMQFILRSAANPLEFMSFHFPRIKFSEASIGDAAAEGIPINVGFTALPNNSNNFWQSPLVIQQSGGPVFSTGDLSNYTIS